MIQLALMEYPASECWYVGDRPEDEQAAAAAGVDFMWADIWRDRLCRCAERNRFRSGTYLNE